jgi:hypothetical protein
VGSGNNIGGAVSEKELLELLIECVEVAEWVKRFGGVTNESPMHMRINNTAKIQNKVIALLPKLKIAAESLN